MDSGPRKQVGAHKPRLRGGAPTAGASFILMVVPAVKYTGTSADSTGE